MLPTRVVGGILGAVLLMAVLWLLLWGTQPGRGEHAASPDEQPTEGPPTLLGVEAPHGKTDKPARRDAPSGEEGVPAVVSEGVHQIQGVVVDERGRPVWSVEVSARHEGAVTQKTLSNRDGTFRLHGLLPGPTEVLVKPSGRTIYRPQSRTGQPGEDMRFVLREYPYVDLMWVDAETGMGLRTTRLEVYYKTDGKVQLRSISSTSRLRDKAPKPYRYRWIIRSDIDARTQIQVRAQGYERSAWIDAPRDPTREPRRVELQPDPEGVAKLVFTVRTDDGVRLESIYVLRAKDGMRTGFAQALEGGVLTLAVAPGAHRIELGDYDDPPEDPQDWYVPVPLDVAVGRGEVLRREIVLERGGYVRFLGFHGIDEVTFRQAEVTLRLDLIDTDTAEEECEALGPFSPGSWSYEYSLHRGRRAKGTFEIRAGAIIDHRPKEGAGTGDDK